LIIGFGKGGKTLAQDLAANGEKVVVIEKSDQMYGGTCINVGSYLPNRWYRIANSAVDILIGILRKKQISIKRLSMRNAN
jgi:pyruvate/2-oxoglutarate dehydrogenase complex dihydrolipoamide dehydrogenase (E3) component